MAAHDPFGTFEHAVAMSDALPNSRIEVIAQCGRSPMWEKPSVFVGTVAGFLNTSALQ